MDDRNSLRKQRLEVFNFKFRKRHSQRQKRKVLAQLLLLFESMGWSVSVQEEKLGLLKVQNGRIGDMETASVIIAAAYDLPLQHFFNTSINPASYSEVKRVQIRNGLVHLLISVLLMALGLFFLIFASSSSAPQQAIFIGLGLLCFVGCFMTWTLQGTISAAKTLPLFALIELAGCADKKQCAFLLADASENGDLGLTAAEKRWRPEQLLIYIDSLGSQPQLQALTKNYRYDAGQPSSLTLKHASEDDRLSNFCRSIQLNSGEMENGQFRVMLKRKDNSVDFTTFNEAIDFIQDIITKAGNK